MLQPTRRLCASSILRFLLLLRKSLCAAWRKNQSIAFNLPQRCSGPYANVRKNSHERTRTTGHQQEYRDKTRGGHVDRATTRDRPYEGRSEGEVSTDQS